ncbi:Retinoblastoma-related protein [Cocos nucifera]|uniref:Retinoblastoma-related protein n=2 Tax=Cocos nucifera TaxID=13894 RepID=RBR_COCNU|nr:RecName: Full=Retinoblastoma-related protein [Cocos nucifera]AAM77469.1 retinoblastoma-like protein [Cocos nucifera]KAG1330964.1 Retinoblastoma-related protein [Cocos nucifera]
MSQASVDMEDVKPSISLPSDDGGAMEARLTDVCKSKLALDESTMRQAMILFRESKHILLANMSAIGSGSPEEIERFWSAFVLYCVTRLSKGRTKQEKEENGITLCRILRVLKMNVVDFFKEIPQFCLKAGYILTGLYGSDWEKRLELKELQANIVHLSLLSRYYKRAYQELFLPNDASSGRHSVAPNSVGYVSDYHHFGWLLFLALRIHAFSRFKDLVTCTNGLVSILAILILHIPARFRNFHIQDSLLFAKRTAKGVDLVASLCDKYHTSEDELRRVMEKANNLIVDILKKKPCAASECKRENLAYINTDGLIYFEDLLEENSLQSSILILEDNYDDAINSKGELDERMFVNDEDSLLGSGSLSGGSIKMKRKYDAMASPAKSITSPLSPPLSPASPVNGNPVIKMVPITPVSTAMTTAKWLRNIISPLPSRPSTELLCFFSSCDRDITTDVTRRASIILGAIFPTTSFGDCCISGNLQSVNQMDSIWAEQRKVEAMKLYYRVLETMCRAESHILNGNNLTSLLSNDRFHRCMLACSAELVLATHKTVTMMFPAVLEKTGITAFDLSKVIESFVRHEETLPRELKRHLNSLEERLLESMAWERGSSMYNSLIVARPTLAAEINRLGLLAEPMPSLDAIAVHNNISTGGLPPLPFQKHEHSSDQNGGAVSPKRACSEYRSVLVERNSFTSPVKELTLTLNLKSKLPPLQSAFASPTRPNPAGGGETCAETGINIFFNKIVKLAAIRIRSLCERLQLPQQILEWVYCLIQQILSQRTALFFNRHIDQIILCSFYGVAKISQMALTFKEIIYNYRKQPQCKPQVFRSVFVHWPSTSHNGKTGQEHVDIITFYNEVFIPSVKPLLVELGPAGVAQKSKSSPEDSNNADSQIPGSPRLSPFPNLPDMSPKKVSAAHNVYVSPLRSSKMDALLSPSSKSYYACVGESTHAYQSPSKDLTAINNRLNSGRKVSGRLNFDVVSDSVVAGSLGAQNGSSAPAPACSILELPVKREQPDS